MSTNITRKLGFGASATIGGHQVLISSGEMVEGGNPTYLTMVDINPDTKSRSKTLHADGVKNYSGSLSFDVTAEVMPLFAGTKLLRRRFPFDVAISDNNPTNTSYSMTDCFLTSLSLNAAAGGIVQASVSFKSKSARKGVPASNAFIRDQNPVGYWWSGGADVRDWTFSMSQEVSEMYGNVEGMEPLYLKVGMVDYTLGVNTYVEKDDRVPFKIVIATKSFSINGVATSSGYRFNGLTDLGTYSYTFESAAARFANEDVITVS